MNEDKCQMNRLDWKEFTDVCINLNHINAKYFHQLKPVTAIALTTHQPPSPITTVIITITITSTTHGHHHPGSPPPPPPKVTTSITTITTTVTTPSPPMVTTTSHGHHQSCHPGVRRSAQTHTAPQLYCFRSQCVLPAAEPSAQGNSSLTETDHPDRIMSQMPPSMVD